MTIVSPSQEYLYQLLNNFTSKREALSALLEKRRILSIPSQIQSSDQARITPNEDSSQLSDIQEALRLIENTPEIIIELGYPLSFLEQEAISSELRKQTETLFFIDIQYNPNLWGSIRIRSDNSLQDESLQQLMIKHLKAEFEGNTHE